MLLYKSGRYTFLASSAGASKVCYNDCIKTFFWKSKMKHVVKSDVYLDILLMGSIYVIKYTFV